jgi:hypothetical protein
MQESFENPETPKTKEKVSPLTIGIGIVVAAAILVSLWFLFEPLQSQKGNIVQQTITLNMAPAEQEYAKKIEVGNIALSRAENFLHQEVTTLNGEVYNSGVEPVLGLSITTEFSDDMNQVVLRETRKVLGNPEVALAPGERRAFEIAFEHVPNSWNMRTPALRVSSLQLPARKK